MPNRDGGQDTRHDLNRQVGYSRWAGNDEGRYASSLEGVGPHAPDSEISVAKTPRGYEAGHSRSEYTIYDRSSAFEESVEYHAGPFKTGHRAEVAARAMSQRPQEKLDRYYSDTKRRNLGPEDF